MRDSAEQEHKKSEMFDPDKAFLELRVVQDCLAILFAVCFVIVAIINITRNLELRFDAQGLSNAARWFRAPVGVFTLSLPIFALLAASHRSEQTKQQMWLTRRQIDRTDQQIEIASKQNHFSNYYKHLEEFTDYCKQAGEGATYEVLSPRRLHARLFPRSHEGDFALDSQVTDSLAELLEEFQAMCKFMEDAESGGRNGVVHSIALIQHRLRGEFYLGEKDVLLNAWWYNDVRHNIHIMSNAGFLRHASALYLFIDKLYRFDTSYETPAVIRHLAKFDYRDIPDEPFEGTSEFDTSSMFATNEKDLDYIMDVVERNSGRPASPKPYP